MKKPFFLLPCLCAALCFAAVKNYQKPTTEELKSRIPASPTEHCASEDGLPDSDCTPGLALTQDVNAICKGPSTKTIRPPSWYTDQLKVAEITEYGYGDVDTHDYEEDHLIPLEIGGHPDDPKNLWPEAHGGQYGSEQKDKVENWLHKQICSGAMTPKEAQDGIRSDWRQYLKNLPAYHPRTVHEVE